MRTVPYTTPCRMAGEPRTPCSQPTVNLWGPGYSHPYWSYETVRHTPRRLRRGGFWITVYGDNVGTPIPPLRPTPVPSTTTDCSPVRDRDTGLEIHRHPKTTVSVWCADTSTSETVTVSVPEESSLPHLGPSRRHPPDSRGTQGPLPRPPSSSL